MVQNRAGTGQKRQAQLLGEGGDGRKTMRILPVIGRRHDHMHSGVKAAGQLMRLFPPVLPAALLVKRLWRMQQQMEIGAMFQQILYVQNAGSLFCPQSAL